MQKDIRDIVKNHTPNNIELSENHSVNFENLLQKNLKINQNIRI